MKKNIKLHNTKKQELLRWNLQFFADGPGGEKTEEPTTKKLDDARKEGQVARSTELITGVSLLVLFLSLKVFVGYLGSQFIEGFQTYFGYISYFSKEPMDLGAATTLLKDGMIKILLIALPIFLLTYIATFISVIIQVKWKVSGKPLQPKLSKFNPVEGFKKMFSKDKVMELLKSIVKIGIIAYLVYNELSDKVEILQSLYAIPLPQAIVLIGDTVINLGIRISAFFLALGFADYIYQKFKFKKDMRMTKQEIKDEFKQTEGDPQIKGRIRNKMREVAQQRMMSALPEADVVITNPTHLAVALKYDREKEKAPQVIAKGADHLAERIKVVARENEIEIVENKPLARMLYFNVELGDEIPGELYQMVAEVLAYVYGLKQKK